MLASQAGSSGHERVVTPEPCAPALLVPVPLALDEATPPEPTPGELRDLAPATAPSRGENK